MVKLARFRKYFGIEEGTKFADGLDVESNLEKNDQGWGLNLGPNQLVYGSITDWGWWRIDQEWMDLGQKVDFKMYQAEMAKSSLRQLQDIQGKSSSRLLDVWV